jgi:hypothetical protein
VHQQIPRQPLPAVAAVNARETLQTAELWELSDMIENSEATKPEVQNEFLKRKAKAQTKEEREMLIAFQNSLQSSGTEEEMVSIAVFSRLAVSMLAAAPQGLLVALQVLLHICHSAR